MEIIAQLRRMRTGLTPDSVCTCTAANKQRISGGYSGWVFSQTLKWHQYMDLCLYHYQYKSSIHIFYLIHEERCVTPKLGASEASVQRYS